jgi:antitoxin component YwqK of YwqJK toxin-antitoxin module
LTVVAAACSVSKPCSEGGDVSWNPKIVGDKKCEQKTLPSGRQINDGPFKQAYESTGNIALEGQFELGRKQGIWLYYGEDGKLRAVKYFDKGVEKTPPPEAQKSIDLIIQQKAGMK